MIFISLKNVVIPAWRYDQERQGEVGDVRGGR